MDVSNAAPGAVVSIQDNQPPNATALHHYMHLNIMQYGYAQGNAEHTAMHQSTCYNDIEA